MQTQRKTMAGEVLRLHKTETAIWPGLPLEHGEQRPGPVVRFGIAIGVLMAAPPPKVWTWNPSVITLLILIASLLLGGGYYLGTLDAERKLMEQRLQKAEQDAEKAKQIGSYTAGATDAQRGHLDPTPTPTARK